MAKLLEIPKTLLSMAKIKEHHIKAHYVKIDEHILLIDEKTQTYCKEIRCENSQKEKPPSKKYLSISKRRMDKTVRE